MLFEYFLNRDMFVFVGFFYLFLLLLVALNRKVLKDYTLSDGTFLPVGTFVAANVTGTHRDSAFYEKPDEFDGFRFANIREGSSEEELKHQMVQTSSDYLAFGHGRLAW